MWRNEFGPSPVLLGSFGHSLGWDRSLSTGATASFFRRGFFRFLSVRKTEGQKESKRHKMYKLGDGLNDFFILTPILGEMIQFDQHIISNGLKPPTRWIDDVKSSSSPTPRLKMPAKDMMIMMIFCELNSPIFQDMNYQDNQVTGI